MHNNCVSDILKLYIVVSVVRESPPCWLISWTKMSLRCDLTDSGGMGYYSGQKNQNY